MARRGTVAEPDISVGSGIAEPAVLPGTAVKADILVALGFGSAEPEAMHSGRLVPQCGPQSAL